MATESRETDCRCLGWPSKEVPSCTQVECRHWWRCVQLLRPVCQVQHSWWRRACSAGLQRPEAQALRHMQEARQVYFPLSPSFKPRDSDCSPVHCCHIPRRTEPTVKALAAVQKLLDDKDSPEDISMDELLLKANVSPTTCTCVD